jgi:hypothetical protein
MNKLPAIPDDDRDFTPELARKIIVKYQEYIAAYEAETGWRSMDSAPKVDGNEFLVWFPEQREVGYGYWAAEGYGYPAQYCFFYFNVDEREEECFPTHWMPLPAAPSPEQETQ